MVAMNFPADCRVLNFLGGGDKACLHCIDSTLLSGSQWWTHVSSPVTICRTNLTGSDSKRSTNIWDVVTRRARSLSVGFLGYHGILQTPSTSSDDHRWWFPRFHMKFALFSRSPVLLFSCRLWSVSPQKQLQTDWQRQTAGRTWGHLRVTHVHTKTHLTIW